KELAPQGVDAAFDTAGRGELPELIEITGDPQRVVTIADPQAQTYGVRHTGGAKGRAMHALAEVADLYQRGQFSMPVMRTFALAEGPQAHRLSEEGHVRGKLVLLVD